ncbi:MAG TPA: hypothetical protein VGO16_18875 [Pseudonocardiaceae bacterium]|jgi:hypothetical protein|nr:hypothetical protein [Pseudonocardiaceae bacterium]
MFLLLAVITLVRLAVNQPSLAISIYALIPIVLAAFWFELRGALITAAAASLRCGRGTTPRSRRPWTGTRRTIAATPEPGAAAARVGAGGTTATP